MSVSMIGERKRTYSDALPVLGIAGRAVVINKGDCMNAIADILVNSGVSSDLAACGGIGVIGRGGRCEDGGESHNAGEDSGEIHSDWNVVCDSSKGVEGGRGGDEESRTACASRCCLTSRC